MDIFDVVMLLTGSLLLGLVVVFVAFRALTRRQGELHEHSVAAAVRAALEERDATAAAVERDRDATVQAAVSRAAEVADAKLDARLRQGTEQINAGQQMFQKQAADINDELRRMQKMITDLQERAAGQHGAVVKGLEQAARATSQLQQTAGGLREVLASPKSRGQWGERMAEDVLRAAGFREGVNYEKQTAIDSGRIPDFTFTLPRNMVVHMDVKFPIDNYVRYLEAAETDDRRADEFRAQFRRDAKTKVTELATRGYADHAAAVDYVLLFMPNESVYSFVHENDPDLIDTALGARIVLCGPSTLFAVLAVIRQAMDNFMLERRGEEIMECLAGFSTEWTKYSEQVDRLGRQLGTVQKTYDQLTSTRTNQLERKLRRIDELQAATGAAELADRETDAPVAEADADIDPDDELEDGSEVTAGRPVLRQVITA